MRRRALPMPVVTRHPTGRRLRLGLPAHPAFRRGDRSSSRTRPHGRPPRGNVPAHSVQLVSCPCSSKHAPRMYDKSRRGRSSGPSPECKRSPLGEPILSDNASIWIREGQQSPNAAVQTVEILFFPGGPLRHQIQVLKEYFRYYTESRTHLALGKDYSASRPLRPLTFRSHVFRGTKFPHALFRAGKVHFAVSTAERSGQSLRVATLERTLVDVLDRPDLSGSWEEIWRSLECVEFFELDKVVEYALLLGNATTGAKVGFFLEQHREPLMVEDRHLKALHDMRPRQPHYLDRSRRKSGRLVLEWNLVVPREVLERTWTSISCSVSRCGRLRRSTLIT